MNQWNKQDREVLNAVMDRIEDARLRYFFLMLGSAIADYCDQRRDMEADNPPAGHARTN